MQRRSRIFELIFLTAIKVEVALMTVRRIHVQLKLEHLISWNVLQSSVTLVTENRKRLLWGALFCIHLFTEEHARASYLWISAIVSDFIFPVIIKNHRSNFEFGPKYSKFLSNVIIFLH